MCCIVAWCCLFFLSQARSGGGRSVVCDIVTCLEAPYNMCCHLMYPVTSICWKVKESSIGADLEVLAWMAWSGAGRDLLYCMLIGLDR